MMSNNENKYIFIINGAAMHGKDTFAGLVSEYLYDECSVGNYSSVSKVKEIAKLIGWQGKKTEKDRKFLSDLKLLTTEYNDMPLNDMKNFANNFMNGDTMFPKMLFLHIREPEEIAKAVSEFATKGYNIKTVLVKRKNAIHIISNMADANVYNYDYDIVINNDGTLEEFAKVAKHFSDDFMNGSLKDEY